MGDMCDWEGWVGVGWQGEGGGGGGVKMSVKIRVKKTCLEMPAHWRGGSLVVILN